VITTCWPAVIASCAAWSIFTSGLMMSVNVKAVERRTTLEGGSMVVNGVASSQQALEAAYAAILDRPFSSQPGDIRVDPKNGDFEVTFLFLVGADSPLAHILKIRASASGKVSILSEEGPLDIPRGAPPGEGWHTYISARRAYHLALEAIKGFENYDKSGRLTIELARGVYRVTFPLPRRSDAGPLSADYAIQIQLDAVSGKVLKKLVAS